MAESSVAARTARAIRRETVAMIHALAESLSRRRYRRGEHRYAHPWRVMARPGVTPRGDRRR